MIRESAIPPKRPAISPDDARDDNDDEAHPEGDLATPHHPGKYVPSLLVGAEEVRGGAACGPSRRQEPIAQRSLVVARRYERSQDGGQNNDHEEDGSDKDEPVTGEALEEPRHTLTTSGSDE
jgi:hypothetical protein